MPIEIHGKEYSTVAERISQFRKEYGDDYGIQTEVLSNASEVLVKATITDVNDRVIATGHALENRDDMKSMFQGSQLEIAETSACGRALANFGLLGTQVEVASGDELLEQAKKVAMEFYAKHAQAVRDNWESIAVFKEALLSDDYSRAVEAWYEIPDKDQEAINLAPSKGGILTTAERGAFKSNEWSDARKAHFGANK